MTSAQLDAAAQCMANQGPRFVRHIAHAYFAAATTDRARLVDAFGYLFERYAQARSHNTGRAALNTFNQLFNR